MPFMLPCSQGLATSRPLVNRVRFLRIPSTETAVIELARDLVPSAAGAQGDHVRDHAASVPELGRDGVRRELDRLQELWSLRGRRGSRRLLSSRGEFYGATVVGLLPFTSRFLLARAGGSRCRASAGGILAQQPPEPFGTREARRFADFLARGSLGLPQLDFHSRTRRPLCSRP